MCYAPMHVPSKSVLSYDTDPLQVVLENKGDIEASYQLLPSNTRFGPFFTFSPSSGALIPGGLQAIQVQLHVHVHTYHM